MYAAGLDVEGAKGECNFGQHEIGFLYADALTTADNHSVYKTAAKEIAAQRGQSITFMAKYNEREGNSCHIHLSLRGDNGDVVFWDDDKRTPLYDQFIAGVLATLQDFTLLYAPNVNSYKRFAAGSFAPTAVAWGLDNRTCAVRLVGHGPERPDGEPAARRRREPLPRPGRACWPAACTASRTSSPSRTRWSATPTTPTSRTCPRTLHDARDLLRRLRDRPGGVRRRGRRPLRQHGRCRARGLRRRTSPTGSSPAPSSGCDRRCTDHTLINPATGAALREVPSTSAEEADAAIERAHDAFASWRAVAPGERARLLRSFAAVVDAHVEELARLEVENSGHTIGNARWEAGNVRDCLNYYSAAPERLFGRQIPVPGGVDVTFREPLGVVGVIVPWNFPMPIAGWGFAPALAAGNTVVLKPAEITPLTAIRIAELALEAGLPEGVFTVLPGQGSVVGQRFVTHPLVRKVCFTGSTEVGKQIMAGCADQVKRVTLELGGKSANIVFADADVASGRGHGAVRRVRQRRPGLLRPLADPGRAVGVRRVRRPSRDRGPRHEGRRPGRRTTARWARWSRPGSATRCSPTSTARAVAFQGSAPDGDGLWLPPTVVESTSTDEAVWREEVFGPVVAVMPFDDEEHAVALPTTPSTGCRARSSPATSGRALRVSRAVEAGNLSVNSHSSVRYWTPFGGFKQSGLGRELGPDAPNAFTEEKNVFFSDERLARRTKWQDASRARSPSSPEGAPGSAWRPYAASSRRARRSSSATSTPTRGAEIADELGGPAWRRSSRST